MRGCLSIVSLVESYTARMEPSNQGHARGGQGGAAGRQSPCNGCRPSSAIKGSHLCIFALAEEGRVGPQDPDAM